MLVPRPFLYRFGTSARSPSNTNAPITPGKHVFQRIDRTELPACVGIDEGTGIIPSDVATT